MSYIAYFDSLRYTAKHFANPIKIRCTHRAHNAVEDAAVSSSANTFVVTVSRGFRSFSDPFISVFGGTTSFVSPSPASSSDEGRLSDRRGSYNHSSFARLNTHNTSPQNQLSPFLTGYSSVTPLFLRDALPKEKAQRIRLITGWFRTMCSSFFQSMCSMGARFMASICDGVVTTFHTGKRFILPTVFKIVRFVSCFRAVVFCFGREAFFSDVHNDLSPLQRSSLKGSLLGRIHP